MSILERHRGFTLVEVMIVLAVVTILAAIAIPAYLNWLPNLRFRQATRDLFMDLQIAKIESVKRNENVRVVLNDVPCPAPGNPVPSPGGWYRFIYADGSVKTVNLPQYVAFCGNTIDVVNDNDDEFAFRPDGTPAFRPPPPPPAIPYTLTLRNDNGRQGTITLSIAGNIALN